MQTIWGGNNGLVGSAFGFGPCDPRVWFHAYFLFSVCYSSWDILQQQQLSILLCPKQSTAALHSPLSWARFSNCIYDDFSHFLSAPKFLLQHFWACLSHAFPVGSKRALPRAMRFPGDALPGRCAARAMRFPGDALPGWCALGFLASRVMLLTGFWLRDLSTPISYLSYSTLKHQFSRRIPTVALYREALPVALYREALPVVLYKEALPMDYPWITHGLPTPWKKPWIILKTSVWFIDAVWVKQATRLAMPSG